MGDQPPICLGHIYINGFCCYCGIPFFPEPTINGMTAFESAVVIELKKQTEILKRMEQQNKEKV
jgi:hypothetical protein